ncbi:Maf family protein [Saltatorellus ferox]|uniref:Maf family protein n=1 Tax=Saltatorellus ferox TaxID=2528018 RepID=UPI003AF3DD19
MASASPRRHDLLGRTGLKFEVEPADADETMNLALGAAAIAEDLALRKARMVAGRRASEASASPAAALILGSDTVVVLGEDENPARRFLEKAAHAQEALEMLRALSGTRHRVITGVAAVRVDGDVSLEFADHETTWVTMRRLNDEELAAYVASGEWEGKAGAYGIQGSADRFVERLEGGGFDNVVGLPVERTLALLGRACAALP